MKNCIIRAARADDLAGACHVCMKTGNYGQDGEPFYRDDPDALGRIFVGPYLAFEPGFSVVLENDEAVCGYALGAFDSRNFYARYDREWRPSLCARFPDPTGDSVGWTRVQQVYSWYHHPDYFCPEPYEVYPSHLHIDLLPQVQGKGYGRRMLEQVMDGLVAKGSSGAHLGVSAVNISAFGFYKKLGFEELIRVGEGKEGCVYLGRIFK